MYLMQNKPQKDMTASPDKYPQGYFKVKKCKTCETLFQPLAPSHLHCSPCCSSSSVATRYLMRNYGITIDDYYSMLKEQNALCAICGQEGFVMKKEHKLKLVVDHCHTTGKVRGLLCHNCNRGLGLFQDNTGYMLNAVKYLEGATTIPEGSTPQAIGGGSAQPLH